MINFAKGAPPTVLVQRAGQARNVLENRHDGDPPRFAGGASLSINDGLWGHHDVRDALSADQHGKCCYCEVVVPKPYAHEHVEHYRPKSSWRQDDNAARRYPGYYWLAYEWSNLLMSCAFCNSSKKSDKFPLEDPATYLQSVATRSTAHEFSLLLNPAQAEPLYAHIEFIDDVPRGISPEGRCTVTTLGLDDPRHEARLTALAQLNEWLDEILDWRQRDEQFLAPEINKNIARILARGEPAASFTAMSRQFIREHWDELQPV